MKAVRIFIFGLLFGWFVKYAIDRIYRDNQLQALQDENTSLRQKILSLETRLQAKSLESRSSGRVAAQPQPVQTGTGKDDLKVIKGIGPAIERKLNEAGIQTFEALAQLAVEDLENILGSTKRLVKDPGSLIAQAGQLAQP